MRTWVKGLDGIRGAAVLAVMLFHTPGSALAGGWIGVHVFFAVSGYVITRQLADGPAATWSSFMARRVARLWPALVVVCTFVACLSVAAGQSLAPAAAAATWTFSPLVVMVPLDQVYLGHTWSLAVEVQFYAAWSAVLLGRPGRAAAATRWFLAVSALALVVSMAWQGPHGTYFTAPSCLLSLAFGALVHTAGGWRLPVAALAGAGAVLAAAAVLARAQTVAGGALWGPGAAAAGALVICHVVAAQDGWLTRALEWPPLRFAGRISYSLYLWHWPVFAIVEHHGPARNAAAAWAAAFAVAVLSHRYVEGPGRAALTASLGTVRNPAPSGQQDAPTGGRTAG